LKLVWRVETRLETAFEGLKLLLNVETCFEVDFFSANAKVHVHAILRLGKEISYANLYVGMEKIFCYRQFE